MKWLSIVNCRTFDFRFKLAQSQSGILANPRHKPVWNIPYAFLATDKNLCAKLFRVLRVGINFAMYGVTVVNHYSCGTIAVQCVFDFVMEICICFKLIFHGSCLWEAIAQYLESCHTIFILGIFYDGTFLPSFVLTPYLSIYLSVHLWERVFEAQYESLDLPSGRTNHPSCSNLSPKAQETERYMLPKCDNDNSGLLSMRICKSICICTKSCNPDQILTIHLLSGFSYSSYLASNRSTSGLRQMSCNFSEKLFI